MQNIVKASLFSVVLIGCLVSCSNSTSREKTKTSFDVAKEKTTKFAQDLLAGRDTSASRFTKDTSYDASQTPILVDSKGNIAEGGLLKYFDEDNHAVQFAATGENEVTTSIDLNDDGVFSDDEVFILIDSDNAIDGDNGPIDVPLTPYVPLKDWLSQHADTDSVDVYIVLPGQFLSPPTSVEVSAQMVQVDTEATKKQILDFVRENNLARNASIDEVIAHGTRSRFQINLTKAKISSLLEKYPENEIWIELLEGVTLVE